MCKPIEILALANRSTNSFMPHPSGHAIPMLPVANKPIIEHLIEAISAHAPANVVVCVDESDGLTAEHLSARAWTDVTLLTLDRAPQFVDRPTLVVRGDIFPTPLEVGAAIMEVRTKGELQSDLSRFGISWLEAGEKVPSWDAPTQGEIEQERFMPDLSAYYRLALAAARGAIAGINPGGWLEADGVRTSHGALVKTRVATGRHVEVGAHAYVDAKVALGDNVIIGERAHIARGACLENVVVLPGAYIGAGVTLRDAVVGGNWLYHGPSGAHHPASEIQNNQRFVA
jgi:NDP-sugar pyrophosphorylase family protein